MKRKNWEGKTHSTLRWISKLAEEVGEVGKEIADAPGAFSISEATSSLPIENSRCITRAIMELEHVEFIAKNFREDLQRRLARNE